MFRKADDSGCERASSQVDYHIMTAKPRGRLCHSVGKYRTSQLGDRCARINVAVRAAICHPIGLRIYG